MTGPFDVEIRHVPGRGRYEAVTPGSGDVGGEVGAVVGFLRYDRHDQMINISNAVVLPEFRGHGVADALTRSALDDARSDGVSVRPDCWYVDQWIHRHPDYHDLRWDGPR